MKPRDWYPPAVDSLGRLSAARWRGRLKVPNHAHPLVRRFYELLNLTGWTQAEICRAAGLSDQTVKGWHRKSPQLVTFEAALNVAGYRLAIVPLDGNYDGRREEHVRAHPEQELREGAG
jgi:transcriptional regulator with XRE-family HTH domain